MWQHLYALFQRQVWYLSAPNKDLSIIAMRHKKEAQSATQHHTKARKIDFLRQIKLLCPLNQKELSALCTQLKTVSFVRGATLIEQGTAGDRMCSLVSARAGIHVQYRDTHHCVAV